MVLVTGATGFLGSWLTRQLVREGIKVRVLIRDRNKLEDLGGLDLDVHEGDITDAASLLKAAMGCEAVFHLAGYVGYSRLDRELMEKVNVGGTRNVITACSKAGVSRLVHMSSVVAIGASESPQVMNEESAFNVQQFNWGYFETKRKAEELVKDAVSEGLVDAVILNPSTIYGEADAKKGSRKTQLKVAQGKLPFYPPGGANVIAVEDVVSATITAWKKGLKGERYILSGQNLKLIEIFRMIAEIANVPPPRIPIPKPLMLGLGAIGDWREKKGKKFVVNSENARIACYFHWFDNKKAIRHLGLAPRPAHYAIEKSVIWMKNQGLLK